MKEWIAVDLDGTLAHFEGWDGKFDPTVIGEPIKPMVERVLRWLRIGKQVKILTARMSYGTEEQKMLTQLAIGDWTNRHLGKRLEATCMKDLGMVELWDDRAIQVETNTGHTIAQIVAELERMNKNNPALRGMGDGV